MKKTIAAALAVILAFSAFGTIVFAEETTTEADTTTFPYYETYYMEFVVKDEGLKIVPLDGYTQYVRPHEDFKFTVEAESGYSTQFTLVEIDGEIVKPDVHGVYTIEDVTGPHTIVAEVSVDSDKSNLFSSLIVFVHDILEWFINVINIIIKSGRT